MSREQFTLSLQFFVLFVCFVVPFLPTQHEWQKEKPPGRAAHRAVEQEGGVGRMTRDRSVHVVDCEVAHARPAIMSSTNA